MLKGFDQLGVQHLDAIEDLRRALGIGAGLRRCHLLVVLGFRLAGLGLAGGLVGLRLMARDHFGDVVDQLADVAESGHHFGQTQFAVLDALVQGNHGARRLGVARQRAQHLVEPVLDTLGQFDLALAGEQLDRAHFAHVHAHRVSGTAKLGVHGREGRRGLFGLVLIGGHGAVAEHQGVGIGRGLVDRNPHVVDHADDVFDLLGLDDIVGQMIVDLRIGEVSLLFAAGNEFANLGLLILACHRLPMPELCRWDAINA